jgi:hypothetical protein
LGPDRIRARIGPPRSIPHHAVALTVGSQPARPSIRGTRIRDVQEMPEPRGKAIAIGHRGDRRIEE